MASSYVRLGIIGAENSHSFKIAEMCNIRKKAPMRVTHIWGETPAFAKTAAEKGAIPDIIKNWKKLAGQVDGVMIDHRHGKYHAPAARYFLERGVPTFVDKPITCDLKEARALFKLAEKHRTPLITFSSKPLAKAYQAFTKKLKKQGDLYALNSNGPAQLNSPHGGIYFYGIHQVDCAIELLGTDVKTAFLQATGPADGVAVLTFRSGAFATLNLISKGVGFRWSAVNAKGVHDLADEPDPAGYATSAKLIANLIAKGAVPFSKERMLAPIAVLEALKKSMRTKKPEPVAKV